MEKNSMEHPRCPNCSKEYIRRVSTAGTKEWLLSIVYVYPFNCQLCRHRFRIFQWRIRYRRVRRDRREFHRLPINFPVSFAVGGRESEGTVVDISMGGCAFQANIDLPEGASLSMALYLSRDHDPVNVDLAVVRSSRQNEIGVEFLELPPTHRERLQSFVHDLWLVRKAMPLETSCSSEAFGDADEESRYVPTNVAPGDSPNPIGP